MIMHAKRRSTSWAQLDSSKHTQRQMLPFISQVLLLNQTRWRHLDCARSLSSSWHLPWVIRWWIPEREMIDRSFFLAHCDKTSELYHYLMSSYNRNVRPVRNNSDLVAVKLGLKLIQIADVVSAPRKRIHSRVCLETDRSTLVCFLRRTRWNVNRYARAISM